LKWRTGGINVDGCRIETTDNLNGGMYSQGNHSWSNESHNWGHKRVPNGFIQPEGRFPANIILECLCDEVIKGEKGEFPGGSTFGGGEMDNKVEGTWFNDKGDIHTNPMCPCYMLDEQSGGASRFFYQAKVSKAERNMGLDEFESKSGGSMMVNTGDKMKLGGASLKGEYKEIQKVKNTHPTVKPINLMTYLCRLITPPNGIVLDPFMGSGSTGISARLEGFKFMGMEMDEDYFKIAETRINNYEEYRKFLNK
jgi:site-specific DNA-methyltransferase (adenine-specific)